MYVLKNRLAEVTEEVHVLSEPLIRSKEIAEIHVPQLSF